MSIHTILPCEALLSVQEPQPYEYCSCGYGQLEGRRDATGSFVVSRIISTDPAAYLDGRCAPGSVITGTPTF